MRPIKLSIPVKTYVRKYIEGKYPAPLKIDYRSTIGFQLYICLEKRDSHWYRHKNEFFHHKFVQLTDKIVAELPANENTFYKTGFEIPEAKSILINDIFEQKIIEEINFRCDLYNKVGFSRAQAIEDFCEEFNIIIDVDITYAAFKKAEYRYRQRKNRAQVSPVKTV